MWRFVNGYFEPHSTSAAFFNAICFGDGVDPIEARGACPTQFPHHIYVENVEWDPVRGALRLSTSS